MSSMNVVMKIDVLVLNGEYGFFSSYLYYWKCYEWIFQNGAIKTKVDWLIQNLQLGNVFQEYLEEMHNGLWIEVIYCMHIDGQIYRDLIHLAMAVTDMMKWWHFSIFIPSCYAESEDENIRTADCLSEIP